METFLSCTLIRDHGTRPEAQPALQELIIEVTSCERGNAVEGSDPLFLPVQIPAAENQEERGRGVTEQNLIWPAHWSIGIEARREQARGLLTLTTGADRARPRAFSDTYQTHCFLSSCLDRAPHPVSEAITVIAVLSPVSGGDTL